MEKEIFLVEELETRLAIETAKYQHQLNEDWQNTTFDPMYFDTFISGKLYGEFVQAIYDRIKPLNSHEANRFLTLSVTQFKTHTPARREQAFILNCHDTYWFPNVVEFKGNEHDVKFAQHVWKHYTNHFNTFKEAAESGLADFKAGTLGNSHTAIKEVIKPTKELNNESLHIFLKALTYNYPYEYTPLNFKYQMRDNLDYLKHEVLENLISLAKDDRMPYLNKIKFDIGNNRQYSETTAKDIQVWLDKYNVKTESDISITRESDSLYRILDSPPPTMDEEFEPNFNRDIFGIQHNFYNYYYGFYIDLAVEFFNEQLQIHNPNPQQNNPSQNNSVAESPSTTKLKTNLSVPQLALLFKMLKDLKPDIFELESEAELLRFISASFETKKSNEDGISIQKLRILFNKPDSKAAEFWEKHFYTFTTEIKKFK